MTITGMRIGAHPSKISSRINILTHLQEHGEQGFLKYGFLTFSDAPSALEVKELANMQLRATEVRLLLLHNHPNVNNFFNQVGLSLLAFTGTPCEDHVMPPKPLNRSTLLSLDPQLNLLTQLKASFVRREQFEEAKQVREMLSFVERAGGRLGEMEAEKQRCIREEDFLGAKRAKEEMLLYREKMADVISNFYDPHSNQLRTIKSDAALRLKLQEMTPPPALSQAYPLRDQNDLLSAEKEVVSEGEEEVADRNESMVSYEDRIIPAVMSRIKGMGQTQLGEGSEVGDNEFLESGERTQLPGEPEKMSPADEANSSHLL